MHGHLRGQTLWFGAPADKLYIFANELSIRPKAKLRLGHGKNRALNCAAVIVQGYMIHQRGRGAVQTDYLNLNALTAEF